MKNKIVSSLLTVVMLTSLLAGCGNNDEEKTSSEKNDTASTSNVEQSKEEEPEILEGDRDGDGKISEEEQLILNIPGGVPDLSGYQIKIVTVPKDDQTYGSYADVLPLYQQVEELTGVDIVWEEVARDSYSTIMSTRFTGDEIPDLFFYWDNNRLTTKEFLEDEIVWDITQFYDVAPNIKKWYEEGIPSYFENFNVDGAIASVPSCIFRDMDDAARYYSTDESFFYRYDIAKELGFEEIPTTIDDWYELLSAVKKAYPDMVPYNSTGGMTYAIDDLGNFGAAYGIRSNLNVYNQFFVNDDGEFIYQPVEDEMKAFITEMNKWYEEGLLSYTAAGDNRGGYPLSGKSFAGMWSALGFYDSLDSLRETDPDAVFYAAPFPTTDGYDMAFMHRKLWEQSMWLGNNKGNEDQARAAAALLDFMFFSDYGYYSQQLGEYGADTWYFDENGNPVLTDEHAKNMLKPIDEGGYKTWAVGGAGWWILPSMNWRVENVFENYKNLAEEDRKSWPQDKWDVYNSQIAATEFNMEHRKPITMIAVDGEADLEIVGQYGSTLHAYTVEQLNLFIQGERDLSEWDDYVNELYDIYHLQEVYDVYKRAVVGE